MVFVLLRIATFLRSTTNSHLLSQCCKFSSSRASSFLGHNRLHLSPLFSETRKDDIKDYKIELVDDATWHVSSGLVEAWRGNNEEKTFKMRSSFSDQPDDDNGLDSNKEDPDFDEIEDMRIRGNLFYKLDKASKEYEEYKFDFHGRKVARDKKDMKDIKEKKKKENPSETLPSKVDKTPKKDSHKEIKKKKESKIELLSGHNEHKNFISRLHEVGDKDSCIGKKKRTPTFNQLTAPYHEPFCLDIYISKGSVRASIIHRATSKVVVVAHSISKDMKFDLGSTKNRSACAAVGTVLAQRALADDIHNVVYTPRKGEKLEGKPEIVLNSIIDGGVNVKVKLKQKKLRQGRRLSTRTHDQD
ncbi:hypothetical protein CDL12_07490 [Handroanthus impetiginosus]|uniref:Uncharacterized protein n=1 Tax=Handroanthus impetiginosus TaxID=429701 RepID=A0A2G9HQM2_9LAMI|nr:hypothetical protein CDL12_07490 [Handroanthus impetiginosus]